MAKMIRWKGKHMGNLKFTLDQQQRAVDTRINRILQDLESEMVPFMQNIVDTTPSGIRDGKDGRPGPKMDRVWSGDMLDALGSEFKNRITLNLGWVKEQEAYFAEQDQGTGTQTGGWGNVPAMHLLENSKIEAEQYVITELRRYFK